MKWKTFAIEVNLLLLWVGILPAQPGRLGADSPRGLVIRQFEERAPKIGEALPDVEIFDAEGKRFAWES